jgi:hypothetical protein
MPAASLQDLSESLTHFSIWSSWGPIVQCFQTCDQMTLMEVYLVGQVGSIEPILEKGGAKAP